MNTIRVFSGPDQLAHAAVDAFIHFADETLTLKEYFTIVLSGGSTPRLMYRLLASKKNRSRVNWARIHVFWGDERCVEPSHEDSNYRMARESLLNKIPIPSANIHRFPSELPPEEAAEIYAETLKSFFGLSGEALPGFDLILLGLGTDGHTASLFPGSDALKEKRKLAVSHFVRSLNAHRLTLTLPVINHGETVMFLIRGQEKADSVCRVLEDPKHLRKLPAQQVQPVHGKLYWLLDRCAASRLHLTDGNITDHFTFIEK